MVRRVRAYIGLGSNVGTPAVTLARAVAALAALRGARLQGVSRLYATTPVGVLDQPDFLNAVVALDVPAGPDSATGALTLLRQLKGLEAQLGRTPGRRWGPRVLDLDLLLFGRARVTVERPPELAGRTMPADVDAVEMAGLPPGPRLLEVPHRDVADRLFVLAPLSDLAPRLVPPGWHQAVGTARRRREAMDGPAAARAVGSWQAASNRWA